jgi:chorismate dehydratase
VPLVYALEHERGIAHERGIPHALTYAEPSVLAEQLRGGEIDVGLVPTMEYLAGTGECIVPQVSISSCGRARSVKLYSNKPWDEVRVVAAHSASRSSAAMAKVLLQEQYGHEVELRRMAPAVEEMLRCADAALLIGDPCLAAPRSAAARVVDLGTVWENFTKLPFVYAVWACAAKEPLAGLAEMLQEAKRRGVDAIGAIARREAGRAGMSAHEIESYLGIDLNHDLSPAHMEGIRAFARLCVRHELLEETTDVRLA